MKPETIERGGQSSAPSELPIEPNFKPILALIRGSRIEEFYELMGGQDNPQ